MTSSGLLKVVLAGSVCSAALLNVASARNFTIPGGDLESALSAYAAQSGVSLIVSDDEVKGVRTKGVTGDMSDDSALSHILSGTGFVVHRHPSGKLGIARDEQSSNTVQGDFSMQLAQAAPPPRAAVETVTVTSSKLGGADVQSIPISITALSQEQLTATQTAGGPDLIKQVPNMTFTKTNFSGYSIQLRGIGTQAISVTTDPAVAVALNDIPFIRNHFFEQEFFDLSQAEVLRGPQGTLYGRNATAGVVNLISAKPTDQFEAMASGEIGNYHQRRFEGMINLPLVDDRLDIRIAGEWTKRQGYSFNTSTDQRIDGRDLWSSRVTIGWKPTEKLQAYLMWEHFSENDDRMRSAKQLCKRDPGPSSVDGVALSGVGDTFGIADTLSQGCLPTSLYSSDAFQTPNGQSLPYFSGLEYLNQQRSHLVNEIDPYASTTQSRNLRVVESSLDPKYKAKNDIAELSADYNITPYLTLTSQTGFSEDFLWSTEDYNRFNTAPGLFVPSPPADPYPNNSCVIAATCSQPIIPNRGQITADGYFCDPQLGCSNRLVAQDLVEENSWQASQEIRLASHFRGPLNFSMGGNYLHYETAEDYYVFINTLTIVKSEIQSVTLPAWQGGVSDNHECLGGINPGGGALPGFQAFAYPNLATDNLFVLQCGYIDPNPIASVNGEGHNYFLSQNPYVLNSYAAFGEAYYDVLPDLKLTGGLRWTLDKKHFTLIPSELLVAGWGYPAIGEVNQSWGKFTGRAAVNWTPKIDFTDQTLVYASYAHGYKAGGANPPGAVLVTLGGTALGENPHPIHPLTFEPEFIDAFEIGSKNTLFDGALTLNLTGFYYNYKNYQISQIVDRTSVNLNFDASAKGVEVESTWEPRPGLRFNLSGGWEDTAIAKGESAIDLMDRTAGHTDWVVLKPQITQASNCILPAYVVAANPDRIFGFHTGGGLIASGCGLAYSLGVDPQTYRPYTQSPSLGQLLPGAGQGATQLSQLGVAAGYQGFDPATAPNNGEGFAKELGGNKLPNAPPLTLSLGAQYTLPISSDWAATLRSDYYWQDYSWARVFNDSPYDRLRGYTSVNLTLILTSQAGWQLMLYDKNVFNETAITGTFLNSDDSGLTTNVFVTDPKLIGVRVTKNW